MTEAMTLGGPGSTGVPADDVAGGGSWGGPTGVVSSGGPNEHPANRVVMNAATAVTRTRVRPSRGRVGDTREA